MKKTTIILTILLIISSCSPISQLTSFVKIERTFVISYSSYQDTVKAYDFDYYVGIRNGCIRFFDDEDEIIYMINYPLRKAGIVTLKCIN